MFKTLKNLDPMTKQFIATATTQMVIIAGCAAVVVVSGIKAAKNVETCK